MVSDIDKLNHTKYICGLYEQIKNAKTKTGASYLACIMGMWSQEYGVAYKKNPFIGAEDGGFRELSSWWNTGWMANDKVKNGLKKLEK